MIVLWDVRVKERDWMIVLWDVRVKERDWVIVLWDVRVKETQDAKVYLTGLWPSQRLY